MLIALMIWCFVMLRVVVVITYYFASIDVIYGKHYDEIKEKEIDYEKDAIDYVKDIVSIHKWTFNSIFPELTHYRKKRK